jgi:hypothetical protein
VSDYCPEIVIGLSQCLAQWLIGAGRIVNCNEVPIHLRRPLAQTALGTLSFTRYNAADHPFRIPVGSENSLLKDLKAGFRE